MVQLPCCLPPMRSAFLSWFMWYESFESAMPAPPSNRIDAERLDGERVEDPETVGIGTIHMRMNERYTSGP